MFVLATIADTVRIPASMLAQPTLVSVHSEMDKKYPNRVIMDMGLVICRYGNALHIGDGVCAAGDGGAHHEVIVRLVVFRPFVEEVCVGNIVKSTEEGVQVSIGFFDDIFVPAYWMLNPSKYEAESGLWIWTPNYEDNENDEGEEEEEVEGAGESADVDEASNDVETVKGEQQGAEQDGEEEDENRFEMVIGAEIRFKVKSINFTQVTNTAKGVQATTTTTSTSISTPKLDQKQSVGGDGEKSVRKRSASMDLSDSINVPASMHIVASICEDGLGLISWWAASGQEEEAADGAEDEGGNDDLLDVAQVEGEEQDFISESDDFY
mmetsp:Transcript_1064/g.2649  ORF Transcript_1064/g.2649 Transcript_1064/m.2649 type:complete len:323 (-) Transcript_1064:1041-2009(-)|eukprot:CAMPEP_0116864712 /NCGR_PEP_ID=MMETSP0418-20121206/24982_1 /TAXON_ID=1158023 /ORGANISM="Astrosyne radiata, Strain 13vi08-1A" /LENGTH=322 /DNA_ID=CAMNT_0004499979 /DNA_START=239 /DNA_END=1207 /DNA_ORIENTATION=+